jgi:hypothetical protein
MSVTTTHGPDAWIEQLEERLLGEGGSSHDVEIAVAD